MCTFIYENRDKVLKGRSVRYLAPKLDISPNYLGNILNGNITCSKRLAKQILLLIGENELLEDYFIIKEK